MSTEEMTPLNDHDPAFEALHKEIRDRDAETIAAIRTWLATPRVQQRVAAHEVNLCNWRDRFAQGLRATGGLTVLSFDPFMFDHRGPMKDSAHMWPEDLDLTTSIREFTGPVILQISTYTANNGNPQEKVLPVWQSAFERAQLQPLTKIAPNGNMMTAVFARGVGADVCEALSDNASVSRFIQWRVG